MTLDELHRTVVDGLRTTDEQFARIDNRFTEGDARLVQIDARFDQVDARFAQIDARFVQVETEFGNVRQEMRELRTELLAPIQEDGETTRRHFNVMVEKVEAAVRIVAEATAHPATVLGNHEIRLQAVEKRE